MEAAAINRPTASRLTRAAIASASLRLAFWLIALALGASAYEHAVIDTVWPDHPGLIAPDRGGIDRKLFWIPIHVGLTLALTAALFASWRATSARRYVWIAIALYAVMRVWSALYFIPVALLFEQGPALAPELLDRARTWVLLSPLRAPLLIGSLVALVKAENALRDAACGRRLTAKPDLCA
jgi:hypothetical protein